MKRYLNISQYNITVGEKMKNGTRSDHTSSSELNDATTSPNLTQNSCTSLFILTRLLRRFIALATVKSNTDKESTYPSRSSVPSYSSLLKIEPPLEIDCQTDPQLLPMINPLWHGSILTANGTTNHTNW